MRAAPLVGLALAAATAVLVGCRPPAPTDAGQGEAGTDQTVRGGQTASPEPTIKVLTPDEALRADAAEYARTFGVSLEEAIRRLELQGEIDGLPTAAQRASAGRWADGRLEHEPDFRYVIRLTGDERPPDELIRVVENWPLPVEIITGTPYTELELLAGMDRIVELVHRHFPRLGMWPDVKAGAIVLEGPDEPTAEFLAELERVTGVPVEYEVGGIACTGAGCSNAVIFELSGDLQNGVAYRVEACVEETCEAETIEVPPPSPNDGPITGSRAGAISLSIEPDQVTLTLPEGDLSGRRRVSLRIVDEAGRVVVEGEELATFERQQPNGPDCPPVCWVANVAI